MSVRSPEEIESRCLHHELREQKRECECPLLERDAIHILQSVNLNSFENALNELEEFLSNLDLSTAETNFSRAANTLDMVSRAFTAIDVNHDLLMTKDELRHYLAVGCTPEVAQALGWLVARFDILEQLSFFVNGITYSELDTARDVFHGLSCLQANFECISNIHRGGAGEILSKEKILHYLNVHENCLEEHDARGLQQLVRYLDSIQHIFDDGKHL